ncbi:metallophosphatase family protein [Chloroflexi bacterium TSY]|nr:metallophosphatase family protein [Chloroflexi bacterium TSY]
MKIALISDIHGNFVSFQAALADIDEVNVDQIVCLGDALATGPQPQQCLQMLQGREIPTVLGNAEAWLLDPQPTDEPSDFMRFVEEVDQWCAEQLSDADRNHVRSFQPTIEIKADAKQDDETSLLCFHGSPLSYNDIIVATTSEEKLAEKFASVHATVAAGGHTHEQMLRRYRDLIIINPGSVGMPFERNRETGEPNNVCRAEYAILTFKGARVSVDFRRVPVAYTAIAQAVRESDMPHATQWLGYWIE